MAALTVGAANYVGSQELGSKLGSTEHNPPSADAAPYGVYGD